MENQSVAVVYFDGVCNLCNASVDFIIQRDNQRVFRFASLQSESGKKVLEENGFNTSDYDSFILAWQGNVYIKSSAALKVAQLLGLPFSLSNVFWIIPSFIRDSVYSVIARNRYRWFGKKETCRLPTPEERSLFIG
jgi:predicted DCC family thiol-disulfide oxidoreductase YuxK